MTNFIPQLYLRDDCKASDSPNPAINCIVVNYAGNAVPVLENGHPADKRDFTTFCNMLSYTRLKSAKNRNFLLSFKEDSFMCDA